MGPLDWLIYGVTVTVIVTLLAAMAVLAASLIRSLFKR
jgi:hypothetical protein